MKGFSKNVFVVVFCSLIFSNFCGFGADTKTAQAQESSVFSELIKINWERLKKLEYFTSKNIIIVLPNNQELYIDWGFAGSGDILTAYPKIETVFRVAEKENSDSKKIFEEVTDNSAFSSLFKIFLKSKLKALLKEKLESYSKEVSVVDWILKVDQSPFAPFVLKTLLLGKHSFEGDATRRNIEIVRLLIRLAQSGLFNASDYQKSLFSYLPETVREFLEQNLSADITHFIDEVWASFGKGFKEYEFDSKGAYDSQKMGVSVTGYVFDDIKLAAQCFDKISSFKNAKKEAFVCSDFEDAMDKIVPATYETIDFKDFSKYKGMKNYKFVGYNSFGRVSKDSAVGAEFDKYLPEKIKTEILAATGLPKIIKIEISDKETWVLCVSDKLTMLDTLKMSFVSFLKGYEEFKQIRTKDFALASSQEMQKTKLSEQEVAELKNLYVDKANLKNELDSFEFKRKKAEQDLQKQKISAGKDQFSQDLLNIEQEKYENLLKLGKKLGEDLEKVEKRSRELEIKSADTLLELAQDAMITGKNAFKLLLNVFVSSPELSEMFVAFKGGDSKYKDIRENIVRRLTYVFRNTENFKENLEIYQYLIAIMFPEFKSDFDKLTAGQTLKKNDTDFFDGVLTSLGL